MAELMLIPEEMRHELWCACAATRKLAHPQDQELNSELSAYCVLTGLRLDEIAHIVNHDDPGLSRSVARMAWSLAMNGIAFRSE